MPALPATRRQACRRRPAPLTPPATRPGPRRCCPRAAGWPAPGARTPAPRWPRRRSPNAPPTSNTGAISAMDCSTTRGRDAPSARRTATSRLRAAARAESSPARFNAATSNSARDGSEHHIEPGPHVADEIRLQPNHLDADALVHRMPFGKPGGNHVHLALSLRDADARLEPGDAAKTERRNLPRHLERINSQRDPQVVRPFGIRKVRAHHARPLRTARPTDGCCGRRSTGSAPKRRRQNGSASNTTRSWPTSSSPSVKPRPSIGDTPQHRQRIRGDARAEQTFGLAVAVGEVEVGERVIEGDALERRCCPPASRGDRRRSPHHAHSADCGPRSGPADRARERAAAAAARRTPR